jgi:hypothetical protein
LKFLHKLLLPGALAVLAIGFARPVKHGNAAGADQNLVLFAFDDEWLPLRDNVKLTLQRPQRYSGNPVLGRGDDRDGPDGYGTALYGTVLHEKDKFRMWYLAWPRSNSQYNAPADRPDYYRPIGYAESTDGIHWTKPNLGLVDYRGNKNNNLVLIEPVNEPYARPVDFNAVLYDPDDPDPSRRYKIAYIVYDLGRKFGTTATAVSADGLRWKLVNTEPFTRGHYENTGLIKFQGAYYASGQNIFPFGGNLPDGTPAGRVMTVLRSPDFATWAPNRSTAFIRHDYRPADEGKGEENHMGAGLWNRGNVILGLYGQWHGPMIRPKPGERLAGLTIDLGFVISNDALHYREPVPDFVMVPRGKPGQWDSQCLLQANAFYNSDTETYIWYSHWDLDNQYKLVAANESSDRQAIGLLKLPRDRFGYLSKLLNGNASGAGRKFDYDTGSIISDSIRLSRSSKLYINADGVSEASPLAIDLLNDNGKPIDGYQASVTKDALKGVVSWRRSDGLPKDQFFRIRVSWPHGAANPHLYALYVEQN